MAGVSPFVGRANELGLLTRTLEAASCGRGRAVLLAGEGGIGKSRLLGELARRAEGFATHWGRAWEAGGAPTLWPWVQVARSVRGACPAAFETTNPQLAWLTTLLPELSAVTSAPPPSLGPEEARFAVLDAMTGVLLRAAEERPQLILLDDIHAADSPSILLFEMLALNLTDVPIVAIASFRPSDAARSDLAPLIHRVRRRAIELALAPFTQDEAKAFLADLLGEDADPETARAVEGCCEGYPLFLEEMARAVRQKRARVHPASAPPLVFSSTGQGTHAVGGGPGETRCSTPQAVNAPRASGSDGLRAVGGASLEATAVGFDAALTTGVSFGGQVRLPVPQGIADAIRERLESLPVETRALLEVASVVGRELDLASLAETAHAPAAEVAGLLEGAVQAALLLRAGRDAYRFTHILVRDVIHEDLPPDRRWSLHRRRAELLRDGGGLEPPLSEIALHFAEAGPDAREEAALAFDRAARHAFERHAFAEAARDWDRALSSLRASDDARRTELLLAAGRAHLLAGRTQLGRAHCHTAARLARALGDGALLARAALTAGDVFVVADVDRALVELLAEAKQVLGERDHPLLARVIARHAAARQPSSDPMAPIEEARQAVAMARRLGDHRTLFETLRSAIGAMMDVGPPAERRPLNREYVELALELREPAEALRGYLRSGFDALELGDVAGFREAVSEAADLEPELAQPYFQWRIRGFQSMQACLEGDLERAEALSEEARAFAETIGDPNATRTLAMQRLGRCFSAGRFDEAEGAAARLKTLWPRSGFLGLYADILLALAQVRAGRRDVALDDRHWSLASRFPDAALIAPPLEIAAALGHPIVERLVPLLEPRAGGLLSWGMLGMHVDGAVDRYLGLGLSALGREQEAEARFRAAERLLRPLAGDGPTRGSAPLRSPRPSKEPAPVEAAPAREPVPVVIRVEGDLGELVWGSEQARLRATKGLRVLARLIEAPGCALHVLDLDGPRNPGEVIDVGDAGPLLDARAKAEYRRRLEDIEEALHEAEAFDDLGRAERLAAEKESLVQELSAAVGLGGRDRRSGRAAERARINVQRRIRDAIRKIGEQAPGMARHLSRSIRTGAFCEYDPGP